MLNNNSFTSTKYAPGNSVAIQSLSASIRVVPSQHGASGHSVGVIAATSTVIFALFCSVAVVLLIVGAVVIYKRRSKNIAVINNLPHIDSVKGKDSNECTLQQQYIILCEYDHLTGESANMSNPTYGCADEMTSIEFGANFATGRNEEDKETHQDEERAVHHSIAVNTSCQDIANHEQCHIYERESQIDGIYAGIYDYASNPQVMAWQACHDNSY